MADWYVSDRENKIEKLTGKELQQKVAGGLVGRDCLIGKTEKGPWSPIAKLEGLSWPASTAIPKSNIAPEKQKSLLIDMLQTTSEAIFFALVIGLALGFIVFAVGDFPVSSRNVARFATDNAEGASANALEAIAEKLGTLVNFAKFFYTIAVVFGAWKFWRYILDNRQRV